MGAIAEDNNVTWSGYCITASSQKKVITEFTLTAINDGDKVLFLKTWRSTIEETISC